jgi:Skp family chaperone for outer membrane proteins
MWSFLPGTLKERILYIVIVLLLVTVIVLAMSGRAQSADSPHQVLNLEVCLSNLETADMMKDHYRNELKQERKLYKTALQSREALWQGKYKRVNQEKAGITCWAENVALKQQIEDEKNFYHWSLKFGGYIKEKTPREIKQHEKKVQAYVDSLDSEELAKLEDD